MTFEKIYVGFRSGVRSVLAYLSLFKKILMPNTYVFVQLKMYSYTCLARALCI